MTARVDGAVDVTVTDDDGTVHKFERVTDIDTFDSAGNPCAMWISPENQEEESHEDDD